MKKETKYKRKMMLFKFSEEGGKCGMKSEEYLIGLGASSDSEYVSVSDPDWIVFWSLTPG